jgi:hypothetical protein
VKCSVAGCRVAYWRDVVKRGCRNADGHQVARDDKDAQLALSSAELVCKVYHR